MSTKTVTLSNGDEFMVRRVSTAGKRCIFISDIHGEAALLRQLLEKVGFCGDDLLFLLGDLCEKGTDSLEVLRLVMDLSKGGNVFALQGNCDVWNKELDPQRPTPWLPGYLRKRAKTLVADLCREQGIPLTPDTDVDALKPVLWAAYQPELQFLGSLPRIIETDRALLVHASVQQEMPPYTDDAHALVKCDDFMGIAPAFHRWVVCGHMPVLNYCRTIGDCKPILDPVKHIVSIDGGNVVNGCGQLNAFVVEGETVWNTAVDKLPVCHATGSQAANDDPVTLNWSQSAVELLEQEPDRLRVRHLDSGRILTVPPKKLYYLKGDPTPRVGVYTTYRLPVSPGDELKLWENYGDWAVCKKDGVLGWVPTALLDL